jgi:hypothetical protein
MDKEFTQWLLYHCTIKQHFNINFINYYWTLNSDYDNSWDGDDVKLYSSDDIYEYYLKIKK